MDPLFKNKQARGLMQRLASPAATVVVLDAVAIETHIVDSATEYNDSDLAARAAGTVQQWVETNDLGADEGLADRLVTMIAGIAGDADDMDEDEAEVAATAADHAWDYMVGKGVSEDDLDALFGEDSDEAAAAAERVRDMLADAMPDGQEAAFDDVNNFAFAPKPVLDAAVYKKKIVVRNGRKTIFRKRVSGVVRRSAAQKMAIRKASMKSHSGAARMHRAKSMRVRKSMGIK
jgi:hypothetical protein